jgi:apolipoprotein N-acyltransferase
LTVAAVQGGGPRGVPAVQADPADVLIRHLTATLQVRPPLELVLWPEDVIDVPGPVTRSTQGKALAGLARRLGATLVAGVVEDDASARFRNAAVAWDPRGRVVARYEKVRRVPFGEYVPARWLVGRLADLSRVPRDAQPGRGPGLLVTPAGRLGTLISYEGFFADRARAAVQAGASVLLVPTNAASYTSGQVPAMQVAAARLRALETGRAFVQAAPTGYSALVDPAGRVMARGGLGGPAVLQGGVELRSGRTLYARTGDGPLLAGAVVALGSAWVGAHRRGRTSRRLRRRNPQETTVCRSRLDIDLRRPDGRGLAEDTYGGYITSGWSCPPELSAVTTKGALAW